jgi:hypothetical protein
VSKIEDGAGGLEAASRPPAYTQRLVALRMPRLKMEQEAWRPRPFVP